MNKVGDGTRRAPLIHDWYTPAARVWTEAMFQPLGRIWVFGCLLISFVLMFLLARFTLWAVVLAAMTMLFVATGTLDLVSYPVRKRWR